MQQTIGVTEARRKLGRLVDQVRDRGDTVVLVKSGKPAAVLVPFPLLEQLYREREKLFAVVAEVQERNNDVNLNDAELMDFVNEAVHAVRSRT